MLDIKLLLSRSEVKGSMLESTPESNKRHMGIDIWTRCPDQHKLAKPNKSTIWWVFMDLNLWDILLLGYTITFMCVYAANKKRKAIVCNTKATSLSCDMWTNPAALQMLNRPDVI